jgi:hypothetical protein
MFGLIYINVVTIILCSWNYFMSIWRWYAIIKIIKHILLRYFTCLSYIFTYHIITVNRIYWYKYLVKSEINKITRKLQTRFDHWCITCQLKSVGWSSLYMGDNENVHHPSRSLAPAWAILNFQHLKVMKSMIPKEQTHVPTLKWNTGQLFTAATQQFTPAVVMHTYY